MTQDSFLEPSGRPPGRIQKEKSPSRDDIGGLSEEQFQEWVRRRSNLPLAVKGHTFSLKEENIIVVDGGKFVYEDALELVRLLNSRSPLAQVNATVMIAERNGVLRLVVLGLVALIIVIVFVLARR
jgi:hypothetical protein